MRILALALAACSGRIDPQEEGISDEAADTGIWSASLLPGGQQELLLPYGVAVDGPRRRAYVGSISFRAVVAVDIDSAELAGSWDLGDDVRLQAPDVKVDGEGVVWVVNGGAPGLMRLDPATGAVTRPETGLDDTLGATPLPRGGMLVLGAERDETQRLVRVEANGEIGAVETPASSVLGLAADAGGRVGMLLRSDAGTDFELRDADTLAVVDACAGPSVGQSLRDGGDGTFYAVAQAGLSRFSCAEGETAAVAEGQNNDVVVLPDAVLVVDRAGSPENAGAKQSWIRRYTRDLVPVDSPWDAGHSSSKGGWDDTLGRLWVNSEDSTELIAIDGATGEVVARVRVGTHLEDMLPDPADSGRVYITGRLSDTIGWLDLHTGATNLRDDLSRWPVSPVLADGVLWTAGHLDGLVVGLDAETLEEVARFDLERPNHTHTFDDLAWDPTRGLLWLSHSEDNVLYGIDPTTGDVTTVPLEGDPIEDNALPAQLQVIVADDGRIWTCRTSDGVVSRVDGVAVVASTRLSKTDVDHDREIRRAEACRLSADGATLWVWGHALDADSLYAVATNDVAATQVIGEIDGAVLGWDEGAREVRLIDAGEVVQSLAIDGDGEQPMFAWDGERLVWTDVMEARATSVWLGW